MKNNEIINLSPVSITTIEFKDQRLAYATERIARIYQNAAKYADEKNREISSILATVADEKSYTKDGFKSVAEYANKVFGIARQNAYALASAGKIYNDETASEVLKSFSPSKLSEICSLPREAVNVAIEEGKISPTTTQKALREFSNKVKEETHVDGEKKSEIEVLDIYTSRPCMTVVPECLAIGLKDPRTMEDWDAFYVDQLAGLTSSDTETVEIVKLTKGYAFPDAKKATVQRRLYFNRSFSIVSEFFTCKDSQITEKADNTKYSIEQLEAMLAAAREEQQ